MNVKRQIKCDLIYRKKIQRGMIERGTTATVIEKELRRTCFRTQHIIIHTYIYIDLN